MGYYDSGARKAMVGRTVQSVQLDNRRERLDLVFVGGGGARGTTDGDCCSQTWIDDLTIPPDIEGATILGLTDSESTHAPDDSPSKHPPEWTDNVQVYHTAIQTTKGEIIIEYRNSSNGYYGGSLEWTLVA